MPADATRIENRIKFILNAVKTWGGAITNLVYNADAITASRIESGMKVLETIAANPRNGFHGSLCNLIACNNATFLPAHSGEPGIPMIVPFAGATAQAGDWATASQIGSYRDDPLGLYGLDPVDGTVVAHDESDSQAMPSPVACRYSIVKGFFQFTGLSAEVPLIQLTRDMADTGVPINYEATVIKYSVPMLLKEGTNLGAIASGYMNAAMGDLQAIADGAMNVDPVPTVEEAQRMGSA